MGPPPTPVEVECIHCGSIYMSDEIRWEPDPNGPDGGWWVCPIEGCDGAGFCFDIFPTDPKVAEQFGVHTWECDESEDYEEFEEFDDTLDPGTDLDPPASDRTIDEDDIPF